ncbi:MAG: hypothetical protein NVSMB27_11260 [Ktedonobacteraceae bacterium]
MYPWWVAYYKSLSLSRCVCCLTVKPCYPVALACFLLSREFFEKVQSINRDVTQVWIDVLHRKMDEQQFTALLASVKPQAHQILEQALREGLK